MAQPTNSYEQMECYLFVLTQLRYLEAQFPYLVQRYYGDAAYQRRLIADKAIDL